ncbi:MAG: globin-coupled sensor protein [Sphingomonadales bacterium]|nr:globin-coupled sensor protein [Sphingomonadales bacterium]MDE2171428.1 globin-coupled sensor protein [Sphingomonadales bacterium]
MSEQNLSEMLAFFGIDGGRQSGLNCIARAVNRYAPAALARFYRKIEATPAVARFFSSRAMMEHARSKQIDHWTYLFSRHPDEAYLAKAEQIGLVHARIGLEPKWYIGGYAMVLEEVIAGMVNGSWAGKLDGGRTGRAAGQLVKLSLLDMTIALSSYFKAEEQRRLAVINHLSDALALLSKGDFKVHLASLPPDYRQIEQDFSVMRDHINSALLAVTDSASTINAGAGEIRQASDDLARRTEQQAATLEETTAALGEVTAGVQETSQGANVVRRTVEQASAQAADGKQVVSQAVRAMDDIQKSAQEIAQIVNVIDGIAFQTNLLALNAGVEAARAGDAGKGFAVVASEVRALAQRSAEASAHIRNLIRDSGVQVDRGVQLVVQSGNTFDGIVDKVMEVSDLVVRIADLAKRQSDSLAQINNAVRGMDTGTQQNAAMVEQSNAAARSLASEAARLHDLVSRFNLDRPSSSRHGADRDAVVPMPTRTRTPLQAGAVPAMRKMVNGAAVEDWQDF